MSVKNANRQIIEVKSDHLSGKGFLFNFNPITMEIEIRKRGFIYIVKLKDLMEFASKSERNIFYVRAYTEDGDELDRK